MGITEFLKDQLSLTMNESKTKIVNFHSETVRFLGADIRREKTLIRTRKMGNTMTKKRVAGRPQMFAPMIELYDKLVQNGIWSCGRGSTSTTSTRGATRSRGIMMARDWRARTGA